ncbi:MAG TPA: DEAD/DEAH box helicase [Pyrinomonadaceae bacterium]|jgi:superfamily II DNA or RNA helicase
MSESFQTENEYEETNAVETQRFQLRSWQSRAVNAWKARASRDFLLVATPGAGKTCVALVIARMLLAPGRVGRVVVICPTEHLRGQWADDAHKLGLALDLKFSNFDGVEVAADFDGVAVTYQQVKFSPSLFRKQCEDEPTFVVFDEIHHAGDDLAWGTALREAFEPAAERLALSGTPFRSDNSPIPFISYHEGRSRGDFSYSYAEALSEEVCAPIYFPTLNGRARYLSRDGSYRDCWLLDDLPPSQAGERLRTVLDPRGAWMATALREADEELTRVRAAGHTEAGALVVAIDQAHAKQIAKLLRRLTGSEPVVAISEDPGASEKIRTYGVSDARFLVCVRMVSEGVDIPRLRVGVFATNITSELFLRQFAGRFVRGHLSATLYIPAVEPITNFARLIKEERDHVLAQAIRRPDEYARMGASTGGGGDAAEFTPLGSTSKAHDTIFDGQSFSVAELSYARQLARELNVSLDVPVLAALLRRHAADAGVFVTHEPTEAETSRDNEVDFAPLAEPDNLLAPDGGSNKVHERASRPAQSYPVKPPPLYQRKDGLRKQTQAAASKLAGLIGVRPFVIHRQWIEMGGLPNAAATEEHLERKLTYLHDRIREAQQARM